MLDAFLWLALGGLLALGVLDGALSRRSRRRADESSRVVLRQVPRRESPVRRRD